jgi:hypothetical protein
MSFSIQRHSDDQDGLSRSMQDEVISIASERLGYSLSDDLMAKIRQRKWSYTGLEMMIDTVRAIEKSEITNYLSKLD